MGETRRLFLVDGYALIYRAFFAMLSRPLTTSRGENTSVPWGIVNFLLRLRGKHHPDFVAWVHDAGTSFRHTTYPEYKATREKLDEQLQQDFDWALQRIDLMKVDAVQRQARRMQPTQAFTHLLIDPLPLQHCPARHKPRGVRSMYTRRAQ